MFILEMQACRLAAEELTPKLHHGRSLHKEPCAHLGCPTQVILKRVEPYISPLRARFDAAWGPRNGRLQEETVRPKGD